MTDDPHVRRLWELARAAMTPPPGAGRIALALAVGAVCHAVFAVAVIAMIWSMYFGLSRSFGTVPGAWAWVANAALLVQFPLVHSLLLNGRGAGLVARLVPGPHGATLATTTFAVIASAQLALLFLLWTPSGVVWWQADGVTLFTITTVYAASWMLLMKASWDAGAEVQSGALGWMSLMAKRRPRFPDMPETGTFRIIRQPIYASFALTLWTVPVWTPDQLLLAVTFTAYCVAAPVLKERRFARRYGARFDDYRKAVPYMVPGKERHDQDQTQ